MKYGIFIGLFISLIRSADAGDLDKYMPPPPQPKSDFQRTLDNPPKQNPPPTALEKIERGQIPSSNNPMPPPKEGFSPQLSPPGVQYRKTFE